MFACADNHNIKVYRFYHGDCPEGYTFKEHVNKVTSINWFDDDTGFVSTGIDGNIIAWKLNQDRVEVGAVKKHQEEEKQVKAYLFKSEYRQSKLMDAVVKSESKNAYFTITDDRQIKEIENGKEKSRFESRVNYSSITSFLGSKVLVAGVSDSEKPGSIQFLRNTWDHILEI